MIKHIKNFVILTTVVLMVVSCTNESNKTVDTATETSMPIATLTPTESLTPTPTLIPTPTQVPVPQNLVATRKWVTDDPYDKHFNRFKDMSESRGDSITGDENNGWLIIHKGIGLSVYIGPSEIKENGDVIFELGSGGETEITNRKIITTSKGVTLLLCPKSVTYCFVYCPYTNSFVLIEEDGPVAFLRDRILITSSNI